MSPASAVGSSATPIFPLMGCMMQVSTQLQASMDQAKSFKSALKETTKMLENTEKTVKSLESKLEKSEADGKELQSSVRA
jgi:septal ring factor EnvC (AmiA/AmiB activator)